MTTSFLYFDLGNVILNFSHRRQCAQMAEVAGCDPELAWQVLYESDLADRTERGELDPRGVYEVFCDATDTRADFEQLEHAGSAIFDLNAPVAAIVAQLRAAGHRLGVLSNTNISHWEYATAGRYGILPQAFELCITSYSVGTMKPDAAIYESAIEAAGVPAAEIFFTDDKQENVDAARRHSLDAEHFTGAAALIRQLRSRGIRANF